MYLCMYVCIYVLYVNMYVNMYNSTYVCLYVCLHVCMFMCMYVCQNSSDPRGMIPRLWGQFCGVWHREVCSGSFGSFGSCGLEGGDSLDRACSRKVPQMLNWSGIWGVWRPGRHLELFVVFFRLFPAVFVVWDGALSRWDMCLVQDCQSVNCARCSHSLYRWPVKTKIKMPMV